MLFTNAAARPLKHILAAGVLLFIFVFFLKGTASTSRLGTPKSLAQDRTSTPEEIEKLCSMGGFKVYSPPDPQAPKRKVYDMFLFNTELDWLEIRLNSMAPYVDYFVIVEAATTFTGLPKRLYLQENWGNFSAFHDKMIHRVVVDPGISLGSRTWDHEDYLRNALVDQALPPLAGTEREPRDGDVLMVSDVDEVSKPNTMLTLRFCEFPLRLTLRSHFYYYSFQWLHRGRQWQHPQATTYHGADTIPPQDLRSGVGGTWIFPFRFIQRWRQSGNLWSAAWHCSSCFATLEEMRSKMQSFSHTKWNTAENRDPRTIIERVRNGLDLFGRSGEIYDRIEDNSDVPGFVLEQPDRFKYLLNRDGEDAAFTDAKAQAEQPSNEPHKNYLDFD